MDKRELKKIIKEDKEFYFEKSLFKRLYKRFSVNEFFWIGKYVILARKSGFYKTKISDNVINKLLYFYYIRKKNKLGQRLNIVFMPNSFGRRIRIYHGNIVVNGNSVIGDDCVLYGNNCIGNNGEDSDSNEVPTLGKNVKIGVGSKIIGNVSIADDVCICAMSLVNKSICEKNSIVGGIPAKIIKSNSC